jgi:DNA repair protein RadC
MVWHACCVISPRMTRASAPPSRAADDAALLAAALGLGPTARRALDDRLADAGGLAGVWMSGGDALGRAIPRGARARLDAWLTLTARALDSQPPPARLVTAADVARFFRPRLALRSTESFWAVALDVRGGVMSVHKVAEGTLTSCVVHAREVFAFALRARAAHLILVHNHPSGDPEPSDEDVTLTEVLTGAGRLMGIPVVDHVVVARGGYRSVGVAQVEPRRARPIGSGAGDFSTGERLCEYPWASCGAEEPSRSRARSSPGGCEDGGSVNQLNPADVFTPASLEFGERTINVTSELRTSLVVREALRVTQVRFEEGGDVFAARTRIGTLRGTSLNANSPLDVIVQFVPRAVTAYDTAMVVVFANGQTVSLAVSGAGRVASSDAGVAVSPSLIQFADTEVDRDVVQPIELENTGEEVRIVQRVLDPDGMPVLSTATFFVTRPSSMDSALPLTLMAGEKARLDLHYHPRVVGPSTAQLRFFAQGFDAAPSDTLSAQGNAILAGDLSCTPLRMEFGAVVRGRSAERVLTCTVTGGVYTVKRAALDDSGSPLFQVVSAPPPGTVIPDGGTLEVRVRFGADGVAGAARTGVVLTSERDRTQIIPVFAEVLRPPLNEILMNVALTWTSSVDLDLHLVRSGFMAFNSLNDCFYQRPTQNWGQSGSSIDDPTLDQESTRFGPEEISIQSPADGGYDVYVHYYRGDDMPTDAAVTVRVMGVERAAPARSMVRCGDLWAVGRLDVSGGNATFTPAGSVTEARDWGRCPP